MTKLERLLNLTAVLLDTDRPLTADALRGKVEGYPEAAASFRRAFERDKDDLRSLGIPLAVERVPGSDPPIDGYRIKPEEYYLPDPGLEPDELAAVHLASLAVRVDGLGEQEALWKLGGLAEPPVETPGSSIEMPADPALVPLFEAITARRSVKFTYNDEERVIDPWRLDFHRGRWYLTGHDHLRHAERYFRLSRMVGPIEIVGEPGSATRSEPATPGRRLQAWEIGGDDPVVVRLRVDPTRVAWARSQFGPDVQVEDEPDGGAVFSVPVVMLAGFRSLVLEFLEHAEILDPPEVRADMIAWLEGVAARG